MSVKLLEQPGTSTSSRSDYHDQFAAAYDTFYRQRDVEGEVAQALELLGMGDSQHKSRVLDFGCGTGSHALALARRGSTVVGVDAAPAMIEQARRKSADAAQSNVQFIPIGGRNDWISGYAESFDGAVSFFNVLNCIGSSSGMVDALTRIRACLRPGATGYFEVWNGAAVFSDLPKPDVRHFKLDNGDTRELIRITVPEVCRIEQRCTLRYRVLELDASSGNYTEFESVHKLHFLTPVQYRHLFQLAGLDVVDEFPKNKPGSPITAQDWYIAYLVERR